MHAGKIFGKMCLKAITNAIFPICDFDQGRDSGTQLSFFLEGVGRGGGGGGCLCGRVLISIVGGVKTVGFAGRPSNSFP